MEFLSYIPWLKHSCFCSFVYVEVLCWVLIFPLLRLLCFYGVALLIGSFYSFQVCQPWLMKSFAADLLWNGGSSWFKGGYFFPFPTTKIWYWIVDAFSGKLQAEKLWLLSPPTPSPGGVIQECWRGVSSLDVACCGLVFLVRLVHSLVKYCPHLTSWESLTERELCFMGLLGLMMDGRGLIKCATFSWSSGNKVSSSFYFHYWSVCALMKSSNLVKKLVAFLVKGWTSVQVKIWSIEPVSNWPGFAAWGSLPPKLLALGCLWCRCMFALFPA